jgi:predicted PurR-regulated permease PerM
MLSARPERREANLRGGWSGGGVKSRPFAASGTAIIFAVAVAALYFAREIFVPLALAILLSFMLAPLVLLLRRLHLGRIPSVLVAVLLAFVVILGIGAFIGTQLVQLADNLPHYQTTIKDKIRSVRGSAGGSGVVERASSMIRDLRSEITNDSEKPNAATAQLPKTAPDAGQQPKPIPVEIHEAPLAPLQLIQSVVGPLLQPLATAAIVFVFLLFILLQREDLRDRFIRLAGARDLQRTTQALDDGVGRLSRYFLMQSAINGIFGLLIGIGLYFIGVPNPVLWGIMAMLLRFVPYIGAPIAAIFPAALALAVDPGWSMLLWVVGLFGVMEPIMGQAVEPVLYGRSTGLSAVAVVVSAAFWTWLWGPLGLLLSTPLTVCLVVLGRHVERLSFLDVLLGDEPALTLEESFYQRVLAGDADEAAHQAEEFLEHRPLSAYYDEVAIKGLALAQLDVNRGVLHHDRRLQIKEAIDGVIDDLSDHDGRAPAGAVVGEAQPDLPPRIQPQDVSGSAAGQASVMCVAGRGSLDEAAAAMLADLLQKHGIAARVVPSPAVSATSIGRFDAGAAQTICLSYLEPGGFTSARYLARRLRRKLPQAKILLGLWTLGQADGDHGKAIKETGVDVVVTSLGQAVAQISREAADAGSADGELPSGVATPAAAE